MKFDLNVILQTCTKISLLLVTLRQQQFPQSTKVFFSKVVE